MQGLLDIQWEPGGHRARRIIGRQPPLPRVQALPRRGEEHVPIRAVDSRQRADAAAASASSSRRSRPRAPTRATMPFAFSYPLSFGGGGGGLFLPPPTDSFSSTMNVPLVGFGRRWRCHRLGIIRHLALRSGAPARRWAGYCYLASYRTNVRCQCLRDWRLPNGVLLGVESRLPSRRLGRCDVIEIEQAF